MGYRPGLGFDIATGIMIGHMLRTPHRHHAAVLHGPVDPRATLAGASHRDGAYYYAAAALYSGTVLSTVPPDAHASAKPKLRPLTVNYDRYALVDVLRMPVSPAWPLRVVLSEVAFSSPAAPGAHAAHPAGGATPPTMPPPSPPVYISLQAASPGRLRTTLLARRASSLLQFLACMLLLGLTAAALAGASAGASDWRDPDDTPSDADGELIPVPSDAAARPPPTLSGAPPAVSADGEILAVGSRVQTQHTRARGGDDSWFAGAVLSLHAGSMATIIYDDGVEEVAPLSEVYVLQIDGEESATQAPPPVQLPSARAADRSR